MDASGEFSDVLEIVYWLAFCLVFFCEGVSIAYSHSKA